MMSRIGVKPHAPQARERRDLSPRAMMVLDRDALDLTFPVDIRQALAKRVRFEAPPMTAQELYRDPSILRNTRFLFSGWGPPKLSEGLLEHAVHLEAVFYGGGSIRSLMTQEAWRRGIVITSAAHANAIPVVEYTVAQIIMCLKRVWQQAAELRESRAWVQSEPGAGGFRSTVGLVSLGLIGTLVAERLAGMDVEVVAYDPAPQRSSGLETVSAGKSPAGLRRVGLEEVFAISDVVSLHTPLLSETRKMIDESLLGSMKPSASLINTARGGIVDQEALIRVFTGRPDLFAVLDVTDPEPPARDCPLWSMNNVILTPHIAGSRGRECRRMGWEMVAELDRYLSHKPLLHAVSQEEVGTRA